MMFGMIHETGGQPGDALFGIAVNLFQTVIVGCVRFHRLERFSEFFELCANAQIESRAFRMMMRQMLFYRHESPSYVSENIAMRSSASASATMSAASVRKSSCSLKILSSKRLSLARAGVARFPSVSPIGALQDQSGRAFLCRMMLLGSLSRTSASARIAFRISNGSTAVASPFGSCHFSTSSLTG